MGMQLLLPRNKVWLIEEEEEEIVLGVQLRGRIQGGREGVLLAVSYHYDFTS